MKEVSHGSLRSRGKDKWQARYRVTDASGSRTVAKTFVAKSRRAAVERQAELREEIRRGGAANPTDALLGQYGFAFIDSRLRLGLIERSTASGYRSTLNRILRCISGKRIDEVTADDIQEMLVTQLDSGLSPTTVAKDFKFLKLVMSYAEDMGHIERSPFNKSLRPPSRGRARPNALTTQSRQSLVSLMEILPVSRLKIAVKLGLMHGLRGAEVCALRWNDILFDRGLIRISASIGMDGSEAYLKGTKSAASERTVPLEVGLAADLQQWAELASSYNGSLSGFVLGTGEQFYLPKELQREFKALSKLLALQSTGERAVTFHSLRHTYATALLDAGVSPKTVADLLGHADPSVTLNIYASTTEIGIGKAMAAIEALAGDAGAAPASVSAQEPAQHGAEPKMLDAGGVRIAGAVMCDPTPRPAVLGQQMSVLSLESVEGVSGTSLEGREHHGDIECLLPGARGEAVSRYLSRGMRVEVGGKLRYSSWESDGQGRSKLEVVADEIEFMGAGAASAFSVKL